MSLIWESSWDLITVLGLGLGILKNKITFILVDANDIWNLLPNSVCHFETCVEPHSLQYLSLSCTEQTRQTYHHMCRAVLECLNAVNHAPLKPDLTDPCTAYSVSI